MWRRGVAVRGTGAIPKPGRCPLGSVADLRFRAAGMLRRVVSHPDFAYAKSGCLLFKAAGCFVLHKVYHALHPLSLMLVRSVLPAGAGEGGASGWILFL